MEPILAFSYSAVYDRILYFFAHDQEPGREYEEQRERESMEAAQRLRPLVQEALPAFCKQISELLGIPWWMNRVTALIIPSWPKPTPITAISSPLTIILHRWKKGELTPVPDEDIIYTLKHEYCHIIQGRVGREYQDHLKNERNIAAYSTRTHILTFALLKKLLPEKEYYARHDHYKNDIYRRAFEFVEEYGADEVIAEARTFAAKNA